VVIGHELTHGFDDQGKPHPYLFCSQSATLLGQQYDGDGNRMKWWTDESLEAFQERTKCFEEQYSQYSLKNQPVSTVFIG